MTQNELEEKYRKTVKDLEKIEASLEVLEKSRKFLKCRIDVLEDILLERVKKENNDG